jgi:copper chaperone CopZ
MEFHVKTTGCAPDVDVILEAVRAVDPSAMVDIDPSGDMLRVAASVDATALIALVNQAGYAVAPDQVIQLPSICCGGCSG